MSIFREEILQRLGVKITDEAVDELEKVLREECKVNGIPYTINYLKTIVATVRRFVILGSGEGNLVMYNGPQVMYAIAVEKLVAKQEQRIRGIKSTLTDI